MGNVAELVTLKGNAPEGLDTSIDHVDKDDPLAGVEAEVETEVEIAGKEREAEAEIVEIAAREEEVDHAPRAENAKGHPVVLFPDHLLPVLLNKRDEVTVQTMTSERKIIESNRNSRRYEELRRYYV